MLSKKRFRLVVMTTICLLIAENPVLTIVHFIKSAIDNSERREVIRKTWGSVKGIGGACRHEVVFVMGTGGKEKERLLRAIQIEKEARHYGDLLQISEEDCSK